MYNFPLTYWNSQKDFVVLKWESTSTVLMKWPFVKLKEGS